MQVSDFTAILKADFGLFPACFGLFRPYRQYRPPADTSRYGRYGPMLAESARFGANRSRFGTNRAESARIREKKKTQTRSDVRATASDAASRVGRGCGTSGAASVFSRYPEAANVFLKQPKPLVLLNNPKKCGHSFLPHPDSTHTHPQL